MFISTENVSLYMGVSQPLLESILFLKYKSSFEITISWNLRLRLKLRLIVHLVDFTVLVTLFCLKKDIRNQCRRGGFWSCFFCFVVFYLVVVLKGVCDFVVCCVLLTYLQFIVLNPAACQLSSFRRRKNFGFCFLIFVLAYLSEPKLRVVNYHVIIKKE